MFRYSAYGLSIHSELQFDRLPPGGDTADVIFRFGSVPARMPYAELDEELALHLSAGWFHIIHGNEIVVSPIPGADPDLLRVLLLGRMMAFLLRQRGWLPLHASGVLLKGQAVLFLGASGSGKSTTAGAFHALGYQVITDDVGAVRVDPDGRCLVRPAGARLRLLDESRAIFRQGGEPSGKFQWDKYAFELGGDTGEVAVQVRRVYILEYGEALKAEVLPRLGAVAHLSTHSHVRHGRMSKEALASHLRDSAAVAGTVPVVRLTRPQSLVALPDLVRWIEADLVPER